MHWSESKQHNKYREYPWNLNCMQIYASYKWRRDFINGIKSPGCLTRTRPLKVLRWTPVKALSRHICGLHHMPASLTKPWLLFYNGASHWAHKSDSRDNQWTSFGSTPSSHLSVTETGLLVCGCCRKQRPPCAVLRQGGDTTARSTWTLRPCGSLSLGSWRSARSA